MKNYLTIGMMVITIIFLSFTVKKGGKIIEKIDKPKISCNKLTETKVHVGQLTLSEMEEMTFDEFNSYLLKVEGNHEQYIKRYFYAKMQEKGYDKKTKSFKFINRDDCGDPIYQENVLSSKGTIKDYDIDHNWEDSALVEWLVAEGGPGVWQLKSFDRLYMIDLDPNPYAEDWEITKVNHEYTSFVTSCPTLTYVETSHSAIPNYSTPGHPPYGSYVFLGIDGLVNNGIGFSQSVSNFAFIEAGGI